MEKVFIVAAKRTAIGKMMGSLSGINPADMAAKVIRNILEETKLDPSVIDEVIVGNILMAGQKQGIARQASVKAGIPHHVPAYSVNMICGSGMKSIMNGCNSILAGQASVVLAGGVENMSASGFVMQGIREGIKMGDFKAVDHMVCDGLTDAFGNYHMGVTAENIAERYNITREQQDAFSFQSQQKAIRAIDAGKFRDEIVPVEIVSKKETLVFDTDEFPNRATTLEKMANLRPAFKKDGTVTAANASGINDGASFVLLASEKAIKDHGLVPLAEIVATAQAGVDPAYMGMGPVPAIDKVLKRARMTLDQMDLVELNEAFAAQSLGVMLELQQQQGVDREWLDTHCNVNGGAIALGHPIGASGNRITVSLLYEMKRRKARYGLASLCIGGGMGTALILKNV
ncbi:MAG TPA: acetyl-CoA C-acetyltransferase [Bacteroidales bacterium]|jgi:acetyl-CoA C-acetyltransferase|nr:acetyl-CoA C-acetyltransferase [Bacteroidales bacterium]OQC57840.1 MAG: Acetyl-CoA acetyltransferase [Bacteroidetes bacterium ADurb.Bin013]MBP8999429.1 acetyl-CoA C-acetyltransferase [Bacteroidales bacterium]MBV6455677.1 Acetyl-CoA acetyltransferase [Bacteroidales bacterium]MCZ2316801.1 acetyl-CoA C-acetyltransferase [Bacteroidales bacterium]